jgi:hypothetical protein
MIKYKVKKYELSTDPFAEECAKGIKISEKVEGKIISAYVQLMSCFCVDLFTNFVYMPTQNNLLATNYNLSLTLTVGASVAGFDQPYFTEIQEIVGCTNLNEINLFVKTFRDFYFYDENAQLKGARINILIAYETCDEQQ